MLQLNPIKILFIDNDRDHLTLSQMILQCNDPQMEVHITQRPRDALERLDSGYHCIVLDYRMPRVNGITLAKKIRKTSDIPIIMYTGHGSEEVAEQAYLAGIDDYVRKEINPSHYHILAKRIRATVEKRQTEKKLQENQELLASFMNSATDGIAILGDDLRYVEVNDVLVRRSGLERGDWIGRHVAELFPEAETSGRLEAYRRVIETGEPFTEEKPETRYGKRSVQIKAFKVKNGLGLISTDVTQIKGYQSKMDALNQHIITLNGAETVEEALAATYEAMEKALAFDVIDVIQVKDGRLVDFQVKDTHEAPYEMPLDGRGVTVRAAVTGETQLVPDVRLDPDYVKGRKNPLSELAVPVKANGETLAVLNTESDRLNQYKAADVKLLETLAYHLSSTLSRILTIQELKDSEDKYRNLMESSRDAVFVLDGEKYLYVNRSAANLLGYDSPEELVAIDAWRHLAPEYREMTRSYAMARQRGEDVPNRYDIELVDRNGNRIDVEVNVSLIEYEGKPVSLAVNRDMRQRREYEKRLAALHENAAELALSDTLDDIFEIALDTIDKILGFTFAGIAEKSGNRVSYSKTRRIRVPDDWEITLDTRSVLVRTFKSGETQHIDEIREDPDYLDVPVDYGVPKSRSEIAVPIRVGDDVAAVINVESPNPHEFKEDDRRLLEILAQHVSSALTRLREGDRQRMYEERLKALHSHAVELSTAKTLQDIYDSTVHAIVETFNFDRVDILMVKGDRLVQVAKYGGLPSGVEIPLEGKGVTVRTAKEKRSILVNDVQQSSDYVYATNPKTGEPYHEYDLSKAELTSPIVVDGEVIGVLNIESLKQDAFTDLDRQHLEILANHVATALDRIKNMDEVERLNQEQNRRLNEGFRRVSSMARHDLRGPLRTIMMAIHLLREKHDEEMLGIIENNIRQADSIMENWKELTLTGEVVRTRVDVGQLVDGVLRSIIVPEGVEVAVSVPGGLSFSLDRRSMARVLSNLVVNSIEAMPRGGTIEICVEEEVGGLVLEVSDTGEGIPEEARDKMFTPFFTTKPNGVGLGMAFIKENVEAHGGFVTYTTEPGRGTTFRISLPAPRLLVSPPPSSLPLTQEAEHVDAREQTQNTV